VYFLTFSLMSITSKFALTPLYLYTCSMDMTDSFNFWTADSLLLIGLLQKYPLTFTVVTPVHNLLKNKCFCLWCLCFNPEILHKVDWHSITSVHPSPSIVHWGLDLVGYISRDLSQIFCGSFQCYRPRSLALLQLLLCIFVFYHPESESRSSV